MCILLLVYASAALKHKVWTLLTLEHENLSKCLQVLKIALVIWVYACWTPICS